jgi:uncharacterized membrane protein
MSLNVLLTSIGLGCIIAALAQTFLPLDGEFLTVAGLVTGVLLLFAIRLPRLHRPIQGRH